MGPLMTLSFTVTLAAALPAAFKLIFSCLNHCSSVSL